MSESSADPFDLPVSQGRVDIAVPIRRGRQVGRHDLRDHFSPDSDDDGEDPLRLFPSPPPPRNRIPRDQQLAAFGVRPAGSGQADHAARSRRTADIVQAAEAAAGPSSVNVLTPRRRGAITAARAGDAEAASLARQRGSGASGLAQFRPITAEAMYGSSRRAEHQQLAEARSGRLLDNAAPRPEVPFVSAERANCRRVRIASSSPDSSEFFSIRDRVRRRLTGDNDDGPQREAPGLPAHPQAAGPGPAAEAAARRRSAVADRRERLRALIEARGELDGSDNSNLELPVRPRPVGAGLGEARRPAAAGSSAIRPVPVPRRQAAAEPSAARPQVRFQEEAVVDLTGDSSDEEVVFVAGNAAAPRAAPAPQRGGNAHVAPHAAARERQAAARRVAVQQDLAELEAVLERRRAQAQQLRDLARADRDRFEDLPVVQEGAAPPGPIRLGGAVLQQGNRRLQIVPQADEAARGGEALQADARAAGRANRRWFLDAARGGLEALFERGAAAVEGVGAGGLFWGVPPNFDDPHAHRHHGGPHHAGQAGPPPIDVQAILAQVESEKPVFPSPLYGFTNMFDLESAKPIEIDDSGDIVKSKKRPFLSCFICHARLRMSTTNEDDRIWSLRCGHLVDQRCLRKISTPVTEKELDSVQPPISVLPVLGAEKKADKRRSKAKSKKEQPREYTWNCPAKGCGKEHKSVKMPEAEEWVQMAGGGAFQLYT